MTTTTQLSGYLDKPYLEDEYLGGIAGGSNGFQANMIAAGQKVVGMQAEDVVIFQPATGMEARHDTLRHAQHGVYLVDGYLEGPYLVEQMCAFMGMQAEMFTEDQDGLGMQVQWQIIDQLKIIGMQSEMKVFDDLIPGMQANQIAVKFLGMQSTMVIYNDTQLRILCEFPSRGTAALLGNNWTANSQASGDFGVNNLNSDVPEEVFRSIVNTNVIMSCDTGLPQGVFLDTLAILNHNISKSATVTLQGADNSGFAPVGVNIPITPVTSPDMYYISPDLPISGYRYWRVIVNDPTNTDGYVQVGIILFGAARIFSVQECFSNPIRHGKRHFKDEIATEAFTRIMNDRALRRYIRMNFEDLDGTLSNLNILSEVFDFARTSLKCLWIPKPQDPARYGIFAKLVEIPEQTTIDNDEDGNYTTLDIELDESN